jgi:hypothetical protein
LSVWYSLFVHNVSKYVTYEAASRPATQEFSIILWNPKVHYRVHKNPPPGSHPDPDESSPYHPILFLQVKGKKGKSCPCA